MKMNYCNCILEGEDKDIVKLLQINAWYLANNYPDKEEFTCLYNGLEEFFKNCSKGNLFKLSFLYQELLFADSIDYYKKFVLNKTTSDFNELYYVKRKDKLFVNSFKVFDGIIIIIVEEFEHEKTI